MSERAASFGWERWPVRKTLDGATYLCRWCAKPLSGGCTAYCSDACEKEIVRRCTLSAMRTVIYERDGGLCAECRVNLSDLRDAFLWIDRFWRKAINSMGAYAGDYPTAYEVRKTMGYASAKHLWELNHKVALAEGGDPIDPENLEILCLKCHRKHTAALAKRLADERKEAKRLAKLKIQPELVI